MSVKRFVRAVSNGMATTVLFAAVLVGGSLGCGSRIDSEAIYARSRVIADDTRDGSSTSYVRSANRADRWAGETVAYKIIEKRRLLMGTKNIWQGTDGDGADDSNWTTTAPGTRAVGTLTFTGQPLDTETVVINWKVYTFQTVLTNSDGHVLIGGTTEDSIDNLVAAIMLGSGAGTKYAAATTILSSCTAINGAGTVLDVTADVLGTDGNALTTTETLTNGSWGGATLAGAVDNWASDDEAEFTGEKSNVSLTTGIDWGSIVFARLSTLASFRGNIATTDNPLQAAYGELSIKGDGAVAIVGNGVSTQVIVDSINGKDALYLGGALPASLGDIVATKSGRLTIADETIIPANCMIIATGPNAYLVMESPGFPRETNLTVIANGARAKIGRHLGSTKIMSIGYGCRVDQNYAPLDGDVMISGYLLYRPAYYSGYVVGTMNVLPGGTLDLSRLTVAMSMQIILHPACTYYEPNGGLLVAGSNVIDLRLPNP